MSRQTCTSHCANCGEHFHGLGAFDLHRRGGECSNPGSVIAVSGKREGAALLQVWTRDGFCDKEIGCWRDGRRVKWIEPVVIWQIAMSESQREALRNAFAEGYAPKSERFTAGTA